MSTYFDGLHQACVEKWERLDALLARAGVAGVVAGDLPSVRYITGYLPYLTLSPSHGQLAVYAAGEHRPVLYPIWYYTRYAREGFPWLDVRAAPAPPSDDAWHDEFAAVAPMLKGAGTRVGVCGLGATLEARLADASGLETVDVSGLLLEARAVKTPAEVALLRDAVRIAEIGMVRALEVLAPARTECDVAGEAELVMRRAGTESHAIVVRGVHAARLQEISIDEPFARGDVALVDLGCYRRGYRAEFARSRVVGAPLDGERARMFELVTEALEHAAGALRPGRTAGEVARRATAVLERAGYGDHAHPYPVGHGLGVTGSEHPVLAPDSDYVLQPNMVMNIEPGIFIPEEDVGIRTEDIWLVTDGDPELLSAGVPRIG